MRVNSVMPGFLVELDLEDRLAVVVGLGNVGRRRAMHLLNAGASVHAIDPAPAIDLSGLEGVCLNPKPYHESLLTPAGRRPAVVLASAIPEVNRRVVSDAKRLGLLVNSATRGEASDFRIPASWSGGQLSIAVSTGGAGPALAAQLLGRFASQIDEAHLRLADLLVELRPLVQSRVTNPGLRRRLLRGWSEPRWVRRIQSHGILRVRAQMVAMLEAAERTG